MGPSQTNSPKPTIVFVPGAFHTEAHFVPISALLHEISFPTITVELPTTARANTATYRDDVYAIRSVLETEVVENGKEVMLAAHSYGGVPACQTVSGLERSKRKAEGKAGGIVHVLFIAALLVEQDQKMADALEGGKTPPWAVFKVRKSLCNLDNLMLYLLYLNLMQDFLRRMVFFSPSTQSLSFMVIFRLRKQNIGILFSFQNLPAKRLLT